MKYETQTQYAVICGICGMRGPWAMSEEGARELAREEGWHLGRDAVCPDCYEEEAEGRRLARALAWLDRDSLLREAYQYATSEARRPLETASLPRFALYYQYLALHGEADYRFPCGVIAFEVKEPERTLFSELDHHLIGAVALWREGERWEYRTGWSVHEAVYGRLPG